MYNEVLLKLSRRDGRTLPTNKCVLSNSVDVSTVYYEMFLQLHAAAGAVHAL